MNDLSSRAGPERSVLREIAAGDADALTQWFHRHKRPLYAFVYYRVGGDPDLAADATQATFTLALERLHQFDSQRGDMITWLRYLSRNIIRDLLARRRLAPLQTIWDRIDESLRSAYLQIDSQLLPEQVLQQHETRELVDMTLANLPPHYREVLEAKYVENQSLQSIADDRETTIDGVKSLLRRARSAFREAFLALAKLEVSDIV